MSVTWQYIDRQFSTSEDSQHITFHDEDLRTAGEITAEVKASENTNSLIQTLKATVKSFRATETFRFTDSEKKVHAIVEPVHNNKKVHKQVLYYKSNKSEKIDLFEETAKSSNGHYCFEYEENTYTIKSFNYKSSSLQQIFLEEEVVAATMREPGKKLIVSFKTERKFQKDCWLWLSILHSLYTGTDNQTPFPAV